MSLRLILMETKAEYDPNTQERVAFRARCERLAAQHLAATVDLRVVDLDARQLDEPVVIETREDQPAA